MPKNILLITADHMRGDAMACSGNTFVQTPNLDRLAATGVNFVRCYTPNPICVPGRASITTGNYSHKATGCKDNGGAIRDGQNKLAEVFNAAGYETYAMGKLHYIPYSAPGKPRVLHGFKHAELAESGRIIKVHDPKGKLRGVEEYFDYLRDVGWPGYSRAHGLGNNDLHPAPSPLPEEHYVDTWVASRTIANLQRHVETRKDKPFLTWMSFPKPHSPYDPPRPYDTLYDPRRIAPPIGTAEMARDRDPYIRVCAVQHGMDFLSPEAIQVMRAHYFGMVTLQDKQIGRVLDFLEQNGLREDTVVIYTADHGDLLGDFGGCYKCNFMEGSVRVPFLWSAPGAIPQGVASRALVGLQDILPTVAGLAGVGLQHPTDGLDMTPVFRGKDRVRDYIVSQCREDKWQAYMITDDRWKYIYTQANGVEELYDMQNDPTELRNLVPLGESLDQAARLRQQLIRWCVENGDTGILADGGLKRSEINVDELCHFKASIMGWRWY